MGSKQARLLAFICVALLPLSLFAQRQKNLDYINKYKAFAIESMNDYKIPASITLAQGILESGAGLSRLARDGNNHFGIKCGRNWRGRKTYHTDDAPNECFRAYRSAKESYDDHSVFLANGPRYAFLFKLDITDYKGWARGLKKAGYATDPSYANRLISLIEDYELYKYDSETKKSGSWITVRGAKSPSHSAVPAIHKHTAYLCNDIVYVVARHGDSFELISKEFGVSVRRLMRYNEVHSGYTLSEGDRVFLKRKKKKAEKPHTAYVVEGGDSMHSISQKFGVRLKNLYRMNRKDHDYMPEVGDVLRLR